jgi:hypothetical protein
MRVSLFLTYCRLYFPGATCCRAVKDSLVEAQVLLLQSQLLLLAGQPDEAAVRVQAAQAAGGAVRHWEESVVTYCRCRLGSRDGSERDALAALEGGMEVLAAVARWVLSRSGEGRSSGCACGCWSAECQSRDPLQS